MGVLLLLVLLGCSKVQKIAFVRTGELISSYQGIKEARGVHFNLLNEKTAALDSLGEVYITLSSDKEINEYLLKDLQVKITEIQSWLGENQEFTSSLLFQGALNQINSFVKSYAKSNNFDLVLGVTSDGNIMYGTDELDITDKVLMELNKSYRE